MKNIMRFALLGSMILFTTCQKEDITVATKQACSFENNAAYKTHPKSAAFQALMDKYVQKGLPGMNLLVKDESGIFVGSSGMADIQQGIPMQPCHIAKAASITKFYLGVAIMKLQEEGVLSLNDPLSKYIEKEKLDKIANGDKAITLRHLMNHTTGFYDVISDNGFYLQVLNNPSKHWTGDELLSFVYGKKADTVFDPEHIASYSNTNFLLLSIVIEKATGKPHSQVLHEKVLDKLGVQSSYYHWHDALPANKIAQGYFDLYNNGTIVNLSNWNTGSGNGYGGLYATVWDLNAFIEALFVKKTLLSQASINEMLVFHPTTENRKNLGVACYRDFIDIGNPSKDYAWGHRGRDLAYTADLDYFPEHKATMALMLNYGTDSESPLKTLFVAFRDEVAKTIVGAK
ncbi:MAG: serine hydrolase [Saprospiraceae bacterium]|nr:serine hydrolase [Saprospiraceae bacterium]